MTIDEDELSSKIGGTKSVISKQKPAKRKFIMETPQKGKSRKRASIQSTPKWTWTFSIKLLFKIVVTMLTFVS